MNMKQHGFMFHGQQPLITNELRPTKMKDTKNKSLKLNKFQQLRETKLSVAAYSIGLRDHVEYMLVTVIMIR